MVFEVHVYMEWLENILSYTQNFLAKENAYWKVKYEDHSLSFNKI